MDTSFLPLSDDQDLLLGSVAQGRSGDWASKPLIGRMRNLGLLDTTGEKPVLTADGKRIYEVTQAHRLETWRKQLGCGALKGSGMRYGVKARCSCGDWRNETNEGGADGKRRMRAAHVRHLAKYLAD